MKESKECKEFMYSKVSPILGILRDKECEQFTFLKNVSFYNFENLIKLNYLENLYNQMNV